MREIMNMEKTGVQNNNYKIVLLSTMFDRTYENVVRFSSRAEQRQFFHIPSIFDNAVTCNFRMSSFLETQIVYNVPALSTYNIPQLLQQNYAIVQDIRNGVYYFYFVTGARQLSGTQISLNLELDVFQTYYIDVTFTSASISRTHLDRFYVQTSATSEKLAGFYSPSFGVNTDLLIPEDFNVAQRITRRDEIFIKYSGQTEIDEKLNNLTTWIYIYVDPAGLSQSGIEVIRRSGAEGKNTEYFSNNAPRYPLPYVILCAPVDATPSVAFKLNLGTTVPGISINTTELSVFLSKLSPHIYNIKFSNIAPFRQNCGTWTTSGNQITLSQNITDESYNYSIDFGMLATIGSQRTALLLLDRIDIDKNLTGQIKPNDVFWQTYAYPFIWPVSSIIGSKKHSKYNPKLYSLSFRKLSLVDGSGNKFNYDIQKLDFLQTGINSSNVNIVATDTADTGKSCARILGGLYSGMFLKSYACLIGNTDNSFPYATDQLKTFLANNKNFFLQRQANIDLSRMKAGLSIASGSLGVLGGTLAGGAGVQRTVMQGHKVGSIGKASLAANTGAGLANVALSGISDFATIENDLKQSNWQLDNLESAPDSLSAASGNPFLIDKLHNFAYAWELTEALDVDLERANDYMCLFGYSYGKLGNIKDFDHSRKYYNYIRAAVEEISTPATFPASVAVRDKFKEIFGRGVRLWHPQTRSDGSLTVTYSYEMENYERSLEA